MESEEASFLTSDYLSNSETNSALNNGSLQINTNNSVTDPTSCSVSRDEGEGAGANRCGRLLKRITVAPLILLYGLALYSVDPVLQKYVYGRVEEKYNLTQLNGTKIGGDCGINGSSEEYKLLQKVQKEASGDVLTTHTAGLVTEIFMTLVLASCSDAVGRKPILYLPFIGYTLRILGVFLAVLFDWPVVVVTAVYGVTGLFGGTTTFFAVSYAYIADITSEKERSFRMFLLDVIYNFSSTIGNLSLAFIFQSSGYIPVLVLSLLFCTLGLLYALYAINETRTVQRVQFRTCGLVSVKHVKESCLLYIRDDDTTRRWKLQVMLLIVAVVSLGQQDMGDGYTLALLNHPVCLTSTLVRFWVSSSAGIRSVGGMLAVRLLNPRIGDVATSLLGSVSGIAYPIGFAYVSSTLAAFGVILLGLFIDPIVTMLRAFSSKLVTSEEQGVLSAGISFVQGLATLLGLYGTKLVSSSTEDVYTLAVYFYHSSIYALSFLITTVFIVGLKNKSGKSPPDGYSVIPGENV